MRATATGEQAAQADAPTVGSLRDLTTTRATQTARATRGGRKRVGRGPAGATAKPYPAAQETRCAQRVPAGAPWREGPERAGAQKKEGSYLEEHQRPACSDDGESVEEMARHVDLVSVTRGSADGQGGASGSVASRDAASRSAALPISALSTALLTALSLGRKIARTSAEALLLHVPRDHLSAKSECARERVTGNGRVERRGRLTQLSNWPATGAAPRITTIATTAQSAGRVTRRFVARWR